MIAFLIGAAFGALFGAGVVLGIIAEGYKVHKKEEWEEIDITMTAQRRRVNALTTENAKLRVSLAAGEMTEDGKKIAKMTMAVLETVITAEEVK
jgi:hypothetical protein